MNYTFCPEDQVFWYLKRKPEGPLKHQAQADILVIGGGMAGLSAAQTFRSKGLSVILIEKHYCGSGASGKSSGFITPDSEYSLGDFAQKYDMRQAHKLWQLVTRGVNFIKENIKNYSIKCDYQLQDTLVVASKKRDYSSDIKQEYEDRKKLGYESKLYTKQELINILNTDKYYGGIKYGDTFGISAYLYCQTMKNILLELGVKIYEETPAIKINNNTVETIYSTIKANKIIVCADYGVTSLCQLTHEVYHAQTFLMISAPLTDSQVKTIFPQDNLMVWDTELIYHYYRMAGENRLMLGGSSLIYSYAANAKHDNYRMFTKLNNYFKNKFPQVNINWQYLWPGLIGISKDIVPIAGFDNKMPDVYYVAATAGLPWASTLGVYSAEKIVDNRHDFDHYFNPYREFYLGATAQKILGTKLTFALSNFMSIGSI